MKRFGSLVLFCFRFVIHAYSYFKQRFGHYCMQIKAKHALVFKEACLLLLIIFKHKQENLACVKSRRRTRH